jgi:hypothetical protein
MIQKRIHHFPIPTWERKAPKKYRITAAPRLQACRDWALYEQNVNPWRIGTEEAKAYDKAFSEIQDGSFKYRMGE